ncbi:MAG: CoA pyrophosphatase [Anaerolineales bacterium]
MKQRDIWPTPEDLHRALQGPLPGRAAQLWMAPQPRPMDADHQPQMAAVLLLLYPGETGWCFPLTVRTHAVANHQGQVSLPGGARHGRESLKRTALRETAEELGVSARDVEILGQLTPLYVAVSDFQIFPFVGCMPVRPDFRPSADEVAQVLETPLEMLLDERIRFEEDWDLPDGRHLHVPYFLIQGHKVWGATAVILGEFVWLLRRLGLATK